MLWLEALLFLARFENLLSILYCGLWLYYSKPVLEAHCLLFCIVKFVKDLA